MASTPRMLAIVLATLALGAAVAGCSAAEASTGSAWHSPSPSHSGTPSPSPQTSGPGTPSPTGKPPTSGSPKPPAPPTGIANGHGPFGSLASTGSSSVALTFDDGPGPYTSQILDLLERNHVKATFCLIGRQVHSYPNEIRRMIADGDTLCNHTWDHDEQLRTRTNDQIRAELQQTNDAVHAIVPDAKIEYFRNPGGLFASNTVSIGQSLGMKPLFWSVDPRDWAKPGTQTIINNVIGKTRPGSIVLSHDGGGDRSQTVAAYRIVLPNLKSRLNLVPLPVT